MDFSQNRTTSSRGKPLVENLPPITEEKRKKKKTFAKRIKRFLKFISVGPLDNGLYFRRKQQYLSVCSGFFTLISGLTILGFAIKVYYDIFTRATVYGDLTYKKFDIKDYQVSLAQFLD